MATILKTQTQQISLPNPLEEDNEGCEASIQVHTSLTNITRVYRRTGGFTRLVMTFNLKTLLADELKTFISENAGDWWTLIDYRERSWRVLLTSNPVDFVEHKRYRVSVTLDFLGVRI